MKDDTGLVGVARVARRVVAALAGLWVVTAATGIAAQVLKGQGLEAPLRHTPLDTPHRLLAHISMVCAASFWVSC
jgi:hypothetical protein